MTWNYRILKSKYKCPSGYVENNFSIHEVYYDEDGNITAYSKDSIAIGGETIEELKDDYKKYGDAFLKTVLIKNELDKKFTKRLHEYEVKWSKEDGEYVGLCKSFPSLSWLAKTKEEALSGIQELVANVSKDIKEYNVDIISKNKSEVK